MPLMPAQTPSPSPGKQVEQAFETSDGASVGYLLYLPKDYDPEKKSRMISFQHGRGESYGPLGLVAKWGPPRFAARGSDATSLSSFAPRKNALSQSERRRSFAFSKSGDVVTVDGINATCLTVTSNGNVYATDADAGKVWLVKPDGSKTLLDEGLRHPTGIALSPDSLWLAVMESHTHWGYSYRVKPADPRVR